MAINMTEKEIAILRGIITAQVEGAINTRFVPVERQINEMSRCLESLARAVRGDGENQDIGILQEHKDMYEQYRRARVILENLPTIIGLNFIGIIVQVAMAFLNNISK